MQRRILLTLSLGLVAVPATARADSFGELVAGVAIPLGEEEYSDVVDESFKLGVRGGTQPTGGLGFEGGLDWTAINDDVGASFGSVGGVDVAWNRFRVLAGARFGKVTGGATPVLVFGRAAAGVDIVHVNISGELLGFEGEESETDVGVALEVGGGALVSVGSVAIGAQVAVPIGLHFDDEDEEDIDHDYTSYDLDLLFTVATSF